MNVLLVRLLPAQVAEASGSDGRAIYASERENPAADESSRVVDLERKVSFSYGINLTQGYISSRESAKFGEGTIAVLNPWGALASYKRNSEIVFRYSPLAVLSTLTGSVSTSYYQGSTFQDHWQFSRRWSWNLTGNAGYGDEGARLFAHFQTSPFVGPDALAVTSLEDKSLDVLSSTGIEWQRARTQTLSLNVSNSYHSIQQATDTRDVASAQLRLVQQIDPLTTLSAYGQVHHYSDSACTRYGFGAGVDRRVRNSIEVDAKAGPEYGGAECGQRLGLYYSGLIRWEPTAQTNVVFTARRDLEASYLGGSSWADLFSVVFLKQARERTTLGFRGSYLRGAPDSGNGGSYEGYALAPEVRWKIRTDAELVAGYYRFQRFAGPIGDIGPGITRNIVSISFQWHSSGENHSLEQAHD